MALIRINSDMTGQINAHDADQTLRQIYATLAQRHGPIVIMTHGFSFAPNHPRHCPHIHILSEKPSTNHFKALAWPSALGLVGEQANGDAIAFGWYARGSIWAAWRTAAKAGIGLGQLIEQIKQFAPHRPIFLMGHSMGARVIAGAFHNVPPRSVTAAIFLAGAEYQSNLKAALDTPAAQNAHIINMTSRQNWLFDFVFEILVPKKKWADRSIGRGLSDPRIISCCIDDLNIRKVIKQLGVNLAPAERIFCHWSVYIRSGVFDFYRKLIFDPSTIEHLRLSLPPKTDP